MLNSISANIFDILNHSCGIKMKRRIIRVKIDIITLKELDITILLTLSIVFFKIVFPLLITQFKLKSFKTGFNL